MKKIVKRIAAGLFFSFLARLAYPAHRYFLEFLKDRLGEDRFQQFLRAYIEEPEDYQEIFAAVFGLSLRAAVARYQQALREGKWSPGL